MGIVIRQSFWGSFFSYVGAILGYLATLIFFPKFFSVEEIGLVRLIQSNAMLLLPLGLFGANGTWIKFFPYLKTNKDLKEQTIGYQLLIIVIVSMMITIIAYLGHPIISSVFSSRSARYADFFYVSLIILFAQSIFEYGSSYSVSVLNIVAPTFLRETFLRLVNIIIVLLFGFQFVSFQGFIQLLILNYIGTTTLLMSYLIYKKGLRISFRLNRLKRGYIAKIRKYSLYMLALGGGGSIIANFSFLITSILLGLEENGILTTCIFIGMVIEMPKRIVAQIATPLISMFLRERKNEELSALYTKSSINLLTAGCLLGIGIITNVQDLFAVIPKGEIFLRGYWVVIIVVLSKVSNMYFGVGTELLMYSKFRKFMLKILLLSSILVVVSNFALISLYGLIGAGIAFAIPTLISQVIRAIWVKKHFGFSLWTSSHAKLILITAVVMVIAYQIEPNIDPIARIIFRSIVTALIFIVGIFFLKISGDINGTLKTIVLKIRQAKW